MSRCARTPNLAADHKRHISKHYDVTPAIGREFSKDLQLKDLLDAPNSDELLRDLAVLGEMAKPAVGLEISPNLFTHQSLVAVFASSELKTSLASN